MNKHNNKQPPKALNANERDVSSLKEIITSLQKEVELLSLKLGNVQLKHYRLKKIVKDVQSDTHYLVKKQKELEDYIFEPDDIPDPSEDDDEEELEMNEENKN